MTETTSDDGKYQITYLTGHKTLDIPKPRLIRNADGSATLDFGLVSLSGDYADLARAAWDAGISYGR